MPFSAREEVARQLRKIQEMAVIQPSKSPWSSPVVLVRKKDGSHRFCIDYCKLNSVTKADTYPLPRIDNLLDQLGKSDYFSMLDLASGFWQIKVHLNLQEKTAFSTPQGVWLVLQCWILPALMQILYLKLIWLLASTPMGCVSVHPQQTR